MVKLRDFESFVDLKTELKAWSFLETRMALLLKLYETATFMKYITVEVLPNVSVINWCFTSTLYVAI